MCHAALHLSAEALAEEVCDRLSKKGLLKANPSYAYKVREAELVEIFEEANLDGRTLLSIGESRRLEEHLLGVTAGEACAWLDHVISELNEMVQDLEMASAEQDKTVVEFTQLSQSDDDFDEVDPAPAQKLPAVKGERTNVADVDIPRSVASCSTCDCIEGMPAQKRVSFSAAPPEVLHVVAYSEVYILHPDKFDFDSDGRYITEDESIDVNLRSTVRLA